jgi:hypothetical protein
MVAVFALSIPHIIVLAPLSRTHILESQKSQGEQVSENGSRHQRSERSRSGGGSLRGARDHAIAV